MLLLFCQTLWLCHCKSFLHFLCILLTNQVSLTVISAVNVLLCVIHCFQHQSQHNLLTLQQCWYWDNHFLKLVTANLYVSECDRLKHKLNTVNAALLQIFILNQIAAALKEIYDAIYMTVCLSALYLHFKSYFHAFLMHLYYLSSLLHLDCD